MRFPGLQAAWDGLGLASGRVKMEFKMPGVGPVFRKNRNSKIANVAGRGGGTGPEFVKKLVYILFF